MAIVVKGAHARAICASGEQIGIAPQPWRRDQLGQWQTDLRRGTIGQGGARPMACVLCPFKLLEGGLTVATRR